MVNMKIRQSGMPDEQLWESFFNVDEILKALNINNSVTDLVEIGCGYGTFTFSAAKQILGQVFAFDIEKDMIELVSKRANRNHFQNIKLTQQDVIEKTTGLSAKSIDYVMLFNILHDKNPKNLLDEAYRILQSNGKVGIIHWRSDIETPRGPDLSIRPQPDQIVNWAVKANFEVEKAPVNLGKYHFGLVLKKS